MTTAAPVPVPAQGAHPFAGSAEPVPSPDPEPVETGIARFVASGPSREAMQALKAFRIIFRSVRQHFHEVERSCGVSGSQLWALSVVVAVPGVRVKDLAQAMAVHQSTASNLVEQLSRQGLIRRERDMADHRIVQLHPTDAGRAVIGRAPASLRGLLPDALGRLDPSRLALLNELLAEVLAGMSDVEPGGALTPLAEL